MEALKSVLAYGGILSDREIDEILPHYSRVALKRNEFYLQPGQICNRVAFVDSGALRVFFFSQDGREVTKSFVRRHQFAVDLESYYDNKPSAYGMQCAVPATLYTLSRNEWNTLSEHYPRLYMLMKTLTEVTLLNKIKDNEFLLVGTAREKYAEFVRRYPELALNVSLQHIASYLQITPQSLSRIRREK